MILNSKFITVLFFIFTIFIFTGCGYKPTAYYAKSAISGDVYVNIDMNVDNSSNSVIVKDAINEMILNKFEANITNYRQNADTYVGVKLLDVSYKAISSDNDGYVNTYRTTVTIEMTYKKRDKEQIKLSVSNYYDYSVDTDSVVTEQNKQESIRLAASKALSDIFSKIAVSTFK